MPSTDSFTQPLPVCTNATHAKLLARGTYRCDACGRVFEEPPERCPHSVLLTKRGGRAEYCSLCKAIQEPARQRVTITRDRDWLSAGSRVSEIARGVEPELEFAEETDDTEDERAEESEGDAA